jgi:hypothetical protein
MQEDANINAYFDKKGRFNYQHVMELSSLRSSGLKALQKKQRQPSKTKIF